MADTPVIRVIGTECPPAFEKAWSKWYSEKHVPDVFAFRGLKKATRYRIRDAEQAAQSVSGKADPQSPKYLAIYEFENWRAVEGFSTSSERHVSGKDWNDNWASKGARLVRSIYYEPIGSWTRNALVPDKARVILLVGTGCQAGLDDDWNKWYDEIHVPDVLKIRDVLKASRYRIMDASKLAKGVALESAAEDPPYLAIYEFDNVQGVDAFDRSPELEVARKGWLEWANVGRARLIWRMCYVPIKSWSK